MRGYGASDLQGNLWSFGTDRRAANGRPAFKQDEPSELNGV